jgi:P-type E1-E2 ATPase
VISLDIPGKGTFVLEHLVCDVNGTLALDGTLIEGVAVALSQIAEHLQIHLITADTHGRQASIDAQLGLTAERLTLGKEAEQKAAFVRHLGAERVAAVGQGANDAAMLKVAALGVAVMNCEGMAVETLLAADLVMPDTLSALECFLYPKRMIATLRK